MLRNLFYKSNSWTTWNLSSKHLLHLRYSYSLLNSTVYLWTSRTTLYLIFFHFLHPELNSELLLLQLNISWLNFWLSQDYPQGAIQLFLSSACILWHFLLIFLHKSQLTLRSKVFNTLCSRDNCLFHWNPNNQIPLDY